MSALHGPIPVRTLGDLRAEIAALVTLPDSTPLIFSVDSDELAGMARPSGRVYTSTALGIDAADTGESSGQPIILFPVVG